MTMQQSSPKKSLGQHWLHDQNVLSSIAAHAKLEAINTVVEVGPGLGTLTDILLSSGATTIAIEFDQELLPGLRAKYSNRPNFQLVNEDILKFDFTTLPKSYKIVANIPYYLTSQLLRILSDIPNKPETAVLLMQKEVTERVCAIAPDMSILAVAVQTEYAVSEGELVTAAMFTPPPKVDSKVLVMTRCSTPVVASSERKDFMRVVKAGFSAKRKTLRNTLSAGLYMTKDSAERLLNTCNIAPKRRAETLTISEWVDLYNAYKNLTR